MQSRDTQHGTTWRRRLSLVMLALALAATAALAVPAVRVAALEALGGTLVVTEAPLTTADVVVVAADAWSAGLLEAADLVAAGISSRTAVFAPPAGSVDLELVRRGVPVEDIASRYAAQLRSLGVRDILPLPRVSGTEEQGAILPGWCRQNGIRSIVVVTSWHHSIRVSRMLRRSFAGDPVAVTVRVARHADFAPDDWWKTREGARTGITELQKLLLDVVRHPAT